VKYTYYPGCSLERNARSYNVSTRAVAGVLDFELEELEDWNCCGATEYVAVDLLSAYALAGRNLALASGQSDNGNQMVAPCSACFLNLSKADHYLAESPPLANKVNQALAAGGLHYQPGSMHVRHLLDVVVNDIGYEAVAEKVMRPLYDLRVAPYYGCLVVRPDFDGIYQNHEYPVALDRLIESLGAEVVDFPLKTHCCGGHMTQISETTALELIRRLLQNAADYDADVIATLCPMCQLNLDAYQEQVNRRFKTNYNIPILYFTQLIGLACGIGTQELGFGKEFVDATPALAKIGAEPPRKALKKRAPKEALPMPLMPEER
jgi:heterodisulfide reductase subunit B